MTLSPVRRFWNLLSAYKKELRQIYFYALLIGIVNLTLPLGIQAIINFLQAGELTSTWLILVGFVLVGIAITGILQILQLRIVENIQQNLFAKSAFEFAFRMPKITFLQLDKVHAPELANRFFDTLTIQKGLPKILIDFSLAAFQIVFGIILLAIYSPFFILLGFFLTFIIWLIFKITGPKGLKTSLVESKYKYSMAHWLEEIARVNGSFKIYSNNKFHLLKTDSIIGQYLIGRENHFRVLMSQFRMFIFFKIIVAASLLLLGGYLVFEESMNIGQFVAAEIVIILIINSVEKVLYTIDAIYDVLTAIDKIGYVTDLELDDNFGKASMIVNEGLSVKVDDIEFGFPEDHKKVIEGLSFELNSNEKAVLKGPSGSGKSLLLQILAGIYKVDYGEIYMNETPLANYINDEYHNNLGISFPINQIFEGTFKENILVGRDIPDQRISEVLKALNLDTYLLNKTQGIDTKVDSGGRRLPRSVIQKLLIARILVNEPKILLMEDPLQFIDVDEKKRIIDYIMHKDRKWTVLVVSDFEYWTEKSERVVELIKK